MRGFVQGKRYVIWEAGFSGVFIFYGAETHLPAYLKERDGNYDYLLIAHYSRFEEIREQALVIEAPEEKIIMPYEV